MKRLALTLTLMAMCGAACADELTAGALYNLCVSPRDIEQTACRYYIFGVVEGAGFMDGSVIGEDGRLVQKQRKFICTPGSLAQSQMVDVFRLEMKALLQLHPEDAKRPALSFVLAAMSRQFPCSTQR